MTDQKYQEIIKRWNAGWDFRRACNSVSISPVSAFRRLVSEIGIERFKQREIEFKKDREIRNMYYPDLTNEKRGIR